MERGSEEVDGGSSGATEEADGDTEPSTKADGWVYPSPLIEVGSVLLSAPEDHFAINQQYFHKSVIFIVEHTEDFTRGLIVNRPTAFSTGDLESLPVEFANSTGRWNVWCGGDCEGLNARRNAYGPTNPAYYCLHTLDRLADRSKEVIRGVYLVELTEAQALVETGGADKDDFLLLAGYCGWAPSQLQDELDRGDTWTMVATDQGALLGKLRDAQAALTSRVESALAARADATGQSTVTLTAADVGDGLADWRQLYLKLGPEYIEKFKSFDGTADDKHTDRLLQLWIDRCLIPDRHQPPGAKVEESLAEERLERFRGLRSGTIVRCSATSWHLGKPAEREVFELDSFLPAQYLHKAVLLTLNNIGSFERKEVISSKWEPEPAIFLLLNGPKLPSSSEDMYFGGPTSLGRDKVFELKGAKNRTVQGVVALMKGQVEEMIRLGVMEVAEGVGLEDLLDKEAEECWVAAGGTLDKLSELNLASLGDTQRRKWFKRFMDLEID